MALPKSGFRVKRWSVVGMEGMWAKMFDPPTASPPTPDKMTPTNPAPEVMAAAGFLSGVNTPHTIERDLMHGLNIPTWDNRKGGLNFFLIREAGNPAAVGTFPGPTTRVPRGSVFHARTAGHGPPPHTIHWHGIEPTPMNDGVGHCSMEIGNYTYQWQPNFIGSYFYHCHRNTMQHFEFGLYGFLVIEPPDAFFATQVLGKTTAPIGHCRDGKRRTAANLTDINALLPAAQKFDFRGGDIRDPDPWTGNPALKFLTDPHAMTVAYDVEALWVFDDRDSKWSDLAPSAFTTYPKHGDRPGFNDQFTQNPGQNGFFAFNDFNADYWFVTGVPVPAFRGGSGTIPTGVVIPEELNSGVFGTQVSINADVNQTILLRCLNGAYNCTEVTFPVDVTVIAWDGRALGVAPFNQYNHAYVVPANTPFRLSVARRFDALIRSDVEVNGFATIKFINTRGENGGDNSLSFDVITTGHAIPTAAGAGNEQVLMTALIPFNIGPTAPVVTTATISGAITNQAAPLPGVTVNLEPMSLGGSKPAAVVTDANGAFSFPNLVNSMYQITPSLPGVMFDPPSIRLTINGNVTSNNFTASADVGAITLSPDKAAPQPPNTPDGVTFTASVFVPPDTGDHLYMPPPPAIEYEYEFKLNKTKVREFSSVATWKWDTSTVAMGLHTVQVNVRQKGATSNLAERQAEISYTIGAVVPTSANTNIADDYSLSEILDSLNMAVGNKNPTLADLKRYDVAPLVNGIQKLDNKINLQDVLVMLRKHVGLPL